MTKNKKAHQKEDGFWKNSIAKFKSVDLEYEFYNPSKALTYCAISDLIREFLGRKASIIEFGCGSGLLLCYLYKNGLSVIGYDNSSYAIKYAKLLQKSKNIKYRLRKTNVFYMKIMKKYDAVISSGVIEHFNKNLQIRFIEKMKKCSKKYLFIMYPNINSQIYKRFIKKQKKIYPLEKEKFNVNIPFMFKKLNIRLVEKRSFGLFDKESIKNNKLLNNKDKKIIINVLDKKSTKTEFKRAHYLELKLSNKVKSGFLNLYIGEVLAN